ncbi:MAG: TIGR01777 family oxidoreductase, partial [Kyrpidia sp.]|nr:TIGR01777 family oxidoreductase [Kyrpidia sp.]
TAVSSEGGTGVGKVGVTGATGFIGRALIRDLVNAGYEVVAVTREPDQYRTATGPAVAACEWSDVVEVADRDGIETWVHLAGEPIGARRWTHRRKQEIMHSRVETTRRVVEAIAAGAARSGRQPVLVSASAVGFYGTSETARFTEDDPGGDDFLASVVKAWEAEARRAEDFGARVARVRLGVVLGRDGGALPRMALPYRWWVGGPIGAGTQWVSWVHRADAVGLLRFAMENPVRGVLNATSPNPVTMDAFGRTLGKVLRRPHWFRVPEPALRLAFGEGADVLLGGQRVIPKRAMKMGYAFQYADLESALREIFTSNKGGAGAVAR